MRFTGNVFFWAIQRIIVDRGAVRAHKPDIHYFLRSDRAPYSGSSSSGMSMSSSSGGRKPCRPNNGTNITGIRFSIFQVGPVHLRAAASAGGRRPPANQPPRRPTAPQRRGWQSRRRDHDRVERGHVRGPGCIADGFHIVAAISASVPAARLPSARSAQQYAVRQPGRIAWYGAGPDLSTVVRTQLQHLRHQRHDVRLGDRGCRSAAGHQRRPSGAGFRG